MFLPIRHGSTHDILAPARRAPLRCCATVALAVLASAPAFADGTPLFDIGDLQVTGNATLGFGAFNVQQANFGAGSFEADHGESTRRVSPSWGEAYAKPGIGLGYDAGDLKFYGAFSTIYAQTLGDGDGSLFTAMRGAPGEIALEEANVGVTGALPAFADGNFDLQLGRQNLVVDDGFLIADGTVNAGDRANYYLAPRSVFDGIGVLHLNGNPVRADIFVLGVDTRPNLTRRGLDQPPSDFAGLDVSWFENAAGETANGGKNYADRLRYVTATYFRIYSSAVDGVKTERDGLNVYSVSLGGVILPSLPDFSFYAQGVLERNAAAERQVRANAFYVEPQWTFSDAPLAPMIFYRYSHFSGAPTTHASTDENYDPLFYSSNFRGGSFGSYYYGEVIGNYFISESNLDVHQVALSLTMPFHVMNDQDSLKLDFLYYRYFYDRAGGLGLSSDSLGQEFNIAAEYQYSPQTSFAAAVGLGTPGSGAKEAIAQQLNLPLNNSSRFDRTSGILEIFGTFNF
jgi:hypothetical protein